MQALEALIEGMLSSTDQPELRIRRNRDGRVSVRIYARNATKTGHGIADRLSDAVQAAAADRRSR